MKSALKISLFLSLIPPASARVIADAVTLESAPGSLTLRFDARRSTNTSAAAVTAWKWSFGDGATSSSEQVDHAFSNSGVYEATLTVWSSGESNTVSFAAVAPLPAFPPSFDGFKNRCAYTRDAATLNHPNYYQRMTNWTHTNGWTTNGVDLIQERSLAGTSDLTGNPTDSNGVLLYPDGQPRYPFVGMPGGNDMGYANHFQPDAGKALSNLRAYLRNGGSWTGNCAGSALPLEGYFWSTGVATGTNPGFVDPQFSNYMGAIPHYGLNLTFNEDLNFERAPSATNPFFASLASNTWNCAYRGGISFFKNSAAGNDAGFEWLGSFSNGVSNQSGHTLNGKWASWIYTPSGSPLTGLIVGNGWHPEISSGAWKWQDACFNLAYDRSRQFRPWLKRPLSKGVTRQTAALEEQVGDRQYHYHPIAIPPGASNLTARVSGLSADCDLFASAGAFPTQTVYQYAATASDTNERLLTIDAPAGSNWIFAVRGDHDLSNGAAYSIKVDWTATVPDTTAPTVTGPPADTNGLAPLTVLLAVDENWGYWSTNGSPFAAFSTAGLTLVLSNTTTLRYYGRDSAGNQSATMLRTYTLSNAAPATNTNTATNVAANTNSASTNQGEASLPRLSRFTATADGKNGCVSFIVSLDSTNLPGVEWLFDWMRDNSGTWNAIPSNSLRATPTAANPVACEWIVGDFDTRGLFSFRVRPAVGTNAGDALRVDGVNLSALGGLQDALSNVCLLHHPWRGESEGIHFVNLTSDSKVRILTLTGRLVAELAPPNARGTSIWNGSDRSGRAMPAGHYLAFIQNASSSRQVVVMILPH